MYQVWALLVNRSRDKKYVAIVRGGKSFNSSWIFLMVLGLIEIGTTEPIYRIQILIRCKII